MTDPHGRRSLGEDGPAVEQWDARNVAADQRRPPSDRSPFAEPDT